jgi:hypothetical protein
VTPPPDDLSHLDAEYPEVAGRIRENLSRLHQRLNRIPWRLLEKRAPLIESIAAVAVDVGFLVHLQALQTARLAVAVQRAESAAGRLEREERRLRRARVAAWVAVGVAVGVAILEVVT